MGARSGPLELDNLPDLDDVPGLNEALDSMLSVSVPVAEFVEDDLFDMNAYRCVVLGCLADVSVMFSDMPTITENVRKDRARRFVTLVFMEHEREVALTQYGNDILVEKREADVEG